MKKLLVPIAGALAGMATPAAAHDFFLLPESFHTRTSGPVVIRATVGSSFPAPEIVVTADRVERVWVRGEGQPLLHLAGSDKTSLLLRATGAQAGPMLVAVKSRPRDVEYAEDRIPLILKEYRVAPEAAAAVERLPRPRTWRVSSRRFAKTLLCVQRCSGQAVAMQPIGSALEFVGHGSAGNHFQLLAAGRPLGSYPVDLVGMDGKREQLKTDAQGIVHLPAGAKGSMMLFAAFLTPPTGAERFTLDLTSLTFAR
jgi:hypothetical protein